MKPKRALQRAEEARMFLNKKDRIVSISLFLVLFIVSITSAFTIGLNKAKNFGHEGSKNLVGLAYFPEDNCALHSDDLIISSFNCETNEDCMPPGLCLDEYEVCGYFK